VSGGDGVAGERELRIDRLGPVGVAVVRGAARSELGEAVEHQNGFTRQVATLVVAEPERHVVQDTRGVAKDEHLLEGVDDQLEPLAGVVAEDERYGVVADRLARGDVVGLEDLRHVPCEQEEPLHRP